MKTKKPKQKPKVKAKSDNTLKKILINAYKIGIFSNVKKEINKSNIRYSGYISRKTKKPVCRIAISEKYKKDYKSLPNVYYDPIRKIYYYNPKQKVIISIPSLVRVPAIQNKKTKKIIPNPPEKYVDRTKYTKKNLYFNPIICKVSIKKIIAPKLSKKDIKKIKKEYIPKTITKRDKKYQKKQTINFLKLIQKSSSKGFLSRQKEYLKKQHAKIKKLQKQFMPADEEKKKFEAVVKYDAKVKLVKYDRYDETPKVAVIYSNYYGYHSPKKIPTVREAALKASPLNLKELKKATDIHIREGYTVSYAYGYMVVYDSRTKVLLKKPETFNPLFI